MTISAQPELDGETLQLAMGRCAARLEQTLEELLSPALQPGELARPERLLAAMRYAALGSGKRLRPFLLVETARLFGITGAGVLRAAAAVEMVHCYSLAHDDLPAMDDDDLRRGKPSLHKAFDEATAILAGDALLTYAFDVMASPPTHPDGAARAELAAGLARAAGLGGMAGGQALDLAAESSATALDTADVAVLQAMKTGALLAFAVDAGAIIGGADAAARAALRVYGNTLGMAFQVADDILDAEGDEATLGKRAGKDAGRNKATFVSLLGLPGARARRDELALGAQAVLRQAAFPGSPSMLLQAARFVVSRRT